MVVSPLVLLESASDTSDVFQTPRAARTMPVYDQACSENCLTPRANIEAMEPRTPSPTRYNLGKTKQNWDLTSCWGNPGGLAETEFLDRPVPALRRSHTPPPLQQNALRVALKENSVAKLEEVLLNDSILVHIPLRTTAGSEPPCIAAVRMGCSVHVLDKLLQHGALATDFGAGSVSALDVVASAGPQALQCTDPLVPVPSPLRLTYQCASQQHWQIPFLDFKSEATSDTQSLWQSQPTCPGFLTERDCCKLAACLIHYGADPTQRWQGILPAERARSHGRHLLAETIEHCTDWQVQRLLQGHRNGPESISGSSQLLGTPANVWDMICSFVAPLLLERKGDLQAKGPQ